MDVAEKRNVKIAEKVIKRIDNSIDFLILLVFLFFLVYGIYALWDNQQILAEANASTYEVYKPSKEDNLSFAELQRLNSDVFGWITIYGTGIDYPMVQGKDNDIYVSTNAKGEFSLSGAIFLDYRNKQDFTDFNNIVYGHHMEKNAMFGDVGKFIKEDYFEERRYGNLYVNGKDYGLEIFAFLPVDAYDMSVYTVHVIGEDGERAFMNGLLESALWTREVEMRSADRVVLLSTCTTGGSTQRHIVAARISEETYEDTFVDVQVEKERKSRVWKTALLIVTLLIIILLVYRKVREKQNA